MCGIFGYIGKRDDAVQIIFDGLKTLEYRGYDSWGIAAKNEGKLTAEKMTGKLPDKLPHSPNLPAHSSLAIGHTRWATHGGVTVANAHPHLDCQKNIAVVHNGIIENFVDLREDLIKKGHTFK
jgi:glutamine---fructose-6-phosphate transaminase (isomerizing)